MSSRTILVVFLALISGAGMAVGVLQSNRPTDNRISMVQEDVLVAVVDLHRGRTVTKADFEIRQWPEGLAPKNALRDVEEALGRVVIGQILTGELILSPKLASDESGLGLASMVPPQMRAVTIMASSVALNVAGFVLPGNKVDVLLNLRGGRGDDPTGGGSTTTLLQAVEVLAVDQQLQAPADNKVDPKALSSVTLLVTPDQANVLDLAQNMGTLSLALRNPTDEADSQVQAATLAEIRRLAMPPQDTSRTMFLDGDEMPPEELAMLLGGGPRTERREPAKWIDTFRGTRRGRVEIREQ